MNIVIFGISGHLSQSKLIPAIKALKKPINLIGFSRSAQSPRSKTTMVTGDYGNSSDLKKISKHLKKGRKTIYYFAIPQKVYGPLLVALAKSGLINKKTKLKDRILIEKPFGVNLNSARVLKKIIEKYFTSDQIFKVDHYGGKIELLKARGIRPHKIKKINIELIESEVVGKRAGFYEEVGALYDVGQNHLLYMLTTILLGAKKDRNLVLKDLKFIKEGSYFAQYEGYKKEKGVKRHSNTETHFTIKAFIDDPKFDHIEIILRSGKAHGRSKSSIEIIDHEDRKKVIELSKGNSAYINIFKHAMEDKSSVFLSNDEVISSWKFIQKAKAHKDRHGVRIYKKGNLPNV